MSRECLAGISPLLKILISMNIDTLIQNCAQIMALGDLTFVKHKVRFKTIFCHHMRHLPCRICWGVIYIKWRQIEIRHFMLSFAKPCLGPLLNVCA